MQRSRPVAAVDDASRFVVWQGEDEVEVVGVGVCDCMWVVAFVIQLLYRGTPVAGLYT